MDSFYLKNLNLRLSSLCSSPLVMYLMKKAQQNALIEDPTVYQYDEIYDDMINKKIEKTEKKTEDKRPRYIENLMKSANKRKIENERRIERQIQKEREKEGDEYADKEVFVTSAYKKKLEELMLEEEKEKREEYLESIGDVTKQRDLSGFYRHLYEQKMGSDENTDKGNLSEKNLEDYNIKNKNETKNASKVKEKQHKNQSETKKRNYRKRKTSEDINKHLSDGEIDDSGDEINRMNLDDIRSKKMKKPEENIDADSDFSIDESSDDNEDVSKKKVNKDEITPKIPNDDVKKTKASKENKNIASKDLKQTEPATEKKPKIDIWKKRTVGEVFVQALKRYYERKAARAV
ncbi:nuclear speckle splicing regulatory protein 1 isoform X1 [Plodia interpunctella]|uniref:nuclear speckle splicing regulatory protein 1 isoform X1 n=1 Tax=Plodia interpunctella TaxID=58824 RepID=UPI0023676125|nr:nuclear speckle splicing regulatory protein 1 isoform X1 [Plodia interpunctella]XP_053617254.1 nuclear speckle splicing regulatory protein 1 isoform X1 [Plodia interpunctella]XP_053617263.1 nuclear speckle splicing regulatory protein 1 isoform X1 [Plodia interpunctella]XP_053617270.1 nuclear speckle splicing regulatory protein 1 isoform X1 [Plodia interpunctella]